MSNTLFVKGAAVLAVLAGSTCALADFGAGRIVVSRIGDGSQVLSANGNSVFFDEFSATGLNQAAPDFTLAIPARMGNVAGLISSGNATSEGTLTLSTDGRYLTYTGYDAALGGSTSLAGTSSATVNRMIARVDQMGNINFTALTDAYNANNPRSVVSTDGANFWTGGTSSTTGGVRYAMQSAVPTTSTQLSTTPTNIRVVNIFNNQLFFSTSSGAFVGVNTFQGGGIPTTSGQTSVNLLGSTGGSGTPSAYDFYMADLNPSVAGLDTAYLADDRSLANGGGLQRWDFDGSAWSLTYTLSTNLTAGLRGLTAEVDGGVVTLFAVTADATGNKLVRVVDGGIGSAFDVLATAPAGTIFRGVDFAPVPTPGSIALFAIGGFAAARRRRAI